jgi:defect-in-organelle-trafficking protein DotA
VIEAMVAAPIVALGITHPEGHDAFGKGEQAVMILMNVFLRPAMMIIGYVAAIALCYVGVWMLNAGFQHAIGFILGAPPDALPPLPPLSKAAASVPISGEKVSSTSTITIGMGYGDTWAGIYAFFFSILIYTSAYLTIVQKSFTLIHYLPDKVLRWIGGQPEGIGGETAGWTEEAKGQIKEAGDKTGAAQGKIGEKLGGAAEKGIEKGKEAAAMVATGGASGAAPAEASAGDEEKK